MTILKSKDLNEAASNLFAAMRHVDELDLDIDAPRKSSHDYTSFQEILKEICSIDKTGIDFTVDGNREKIIKAQNTKLEALTKNMLDNKNLKIS